MGQTRRTNMWLNHLDLLPGDPSVFTSFNAVQSGGLVVQSNTTGDIAQGAAIKWCIQLSRYPPTTSLRE